MVQYTWYSDARHNIVIYKFNANQNKNGTIAKHAVWFPSEKIFNTKRAVLRSIMKHIKVRDLRK